MTPYPLVLRREEKRREGKQKKKEKKKKEEEKTYKNPSAKIKSKPVLCRLESAFIDKTTGTGSKKIKKSVATWRPSTAHM